MPIRHDRRGVSTEIKVRFAPPTMCRLTPVVGGSFLKCSVDGVIDQLYIVKNTFHKNGYIPLRHYFISFNSLLQKLTPYQASRIAIRMFYDLVSDGSGHLCNTFDGSRLLAQRLEYISNMLIFNLDETLINQCLHQII